MQKTTMTYIVLFNCSHPLGYFCFLTVNVFATFVIAVRESLSCVKSWFLTSVSPCEDLKWAEDAKNKHTNKKAHNTYSKIQMKHLAGICCPSKTLYIHMSLF